MDAITRTAYARLAGVDAPKIDPRTGLEEEKRRIVVTMPKTLQQVLPGGHLAEKGETILHVYVSDLEEILKLVEPATATDRADVQREYDRQLQSWRNANKGVPDRACPISFEAAFQHVMGRPMLPLEKVEVLDGGKRKAA